MRIVIASVIRKRSALALGLGLLTRSPLTAQTAALSADVTPLAAAAGLRGQVVCVGGFAVIRHADPASLPAELATPERLAETRVHEHVHWVQLSQGCDSILARWARLPLEQLEAEAEAHCTAVLVIADSSERRRLTGQARLVESRVLGNAVEFAAIWAAYERWCGP